MSSPEVGPRSFWTLVHAVPRESGVVLVVSLASYEHVGATLGIPAVEESARRLQRAVTGSTPDTATAGYLGWVVHGVFLPGADEAQANRYIRALKRCADEEERQEIVPGHWAELRLAVGLVPVAGGWDPLEALRRAIQRAKQDPRTPTDHRIPIYDEAGALLAE